MSGVAFSADAPHSGAYVVYINGIEVPTKSVSQREGVWQMPEAVIEMVADPVLTRLGTEDRVQVVIFALDDVAVDSSVAPAFRSFFEGEITGWGYRNTPGGRAITFTAVSQMAVFTQLFVQFLTTFDDLLGYASNPGSGIAGEGVPSSEIVFPFSLFKQGLIPQGQTDAGTGLPLQQDPASITRPFDFLYNVVRNMIGAQVPPAQQTVPAANFFSRWARLTNFHNRFMASPFFDEAVDNANVFPVLKALQNVSAVDVIAKSLLPQVQNAGSIWDMLQLVYQTVLMEIAMISAMPLVTVDLATSLVVDTDFSQHKLVLSDGKYVSGIPADTRRTQPKRIPNFFPKPQLLFGIPPSCNVFFPSQVKMLAYDENYATQPTRLYFNDETVTRLLNLQGNARDTVMNALTTAYPPEADAANLQHKLFPKFNGKNFLLFPEEFFKGPVMDRRDVPPWLFFLRQGELASKTSVETGDGSTPTPDPVAQTGAATKTTTSLPPPAGTMNTGTRVGALDPTGKRVFDRSVERLRSKVERLAISAGVPTDFLLAWIQHESDGDISSITNLNERGYFQIMGPHVERDGTVLHLKDVEAGRIGLSLDDTGTGPDTQGARLSVDEDFSLQAGVRLVQFYRRLANTNRAFFGLDWSEGDMWRLTKLEHNASGEAKVLLQRSKTALGHAPASWDEMYQSVLAGASSLDLRILNNATGVGGVVAGATGRMTTEGDKVAIKAPTPTPAPVTPTDASASAQTDTGVAPSGTVSPDLYDQVREGNETVYQLYAKYEYFRERYARRTGSVHLSWNPYAVPGFPAAIFDQRGTRVDLLCYITTIQRTMSHSGERSTTASFVYGRTFQEMLDLLAQDFTEGGAAAGSSPREPIRDIRKVAQNFAQAETYYQKLFYGGRRLFGKDAACDWRKLIGYAPAVPGGTPTLIFIDGPDEAVQDDQASAQATITNVTPVRDKLIAQILDLQAQQSAAVAAVASLQASSDATLSTVERTVLQAAEANIAAIAAQIDLLASQVALANGKIDKAIAVLQTPVSTDVAVTHNVSGDRELVPLPSAAEFFASYDAAMRYNWRPISSIDEHVIFYDSAAEGAREAGGARYFDRIRRLTGLTPDTVLPTAADGLNIPATITNPETVAQQGPVDATTGEPAQAAPVQTTVPGLTQDNFPQTRSSWDKVLLAYRYNVYTVKAPRT